MNSDSRLLTLYQRAIKHYRGHEGNRWVVPDSIPIVYFGNLQSYLISGRGLSPWIEPVGVEFDEDRFGHEANSCSDQHAESALTTFETTPIRIGSTGRSRRYCSRWVHPTTRRFIPAPLRDDGLGNQDKRRAAHEFMLPTCDSTHLE